VPAGDPFFLEKIRQRGRRAITVGYSEGSDYRIAGVRTVKGEVSFSINGIHEFSFPGQAAFLALNAGLAIAMARNLGMAWEEIPAKWEDVGFASGRFRETILPNGVCVIDDSYNANPVSFENALSAFRLLPGSGRKIVVFADMLELGAGEERFHRELGEKIAASGVDLALAYGKRARWSIEAATGTEARHFEDGLALLEFLKEILRPGDAVLFKGSRSMHVVKVLEAFATFLFHHPYNFRVLTRACFISYTTFQIIRSSSIFSAISRSVRPARALRHFSFPCGWDPGASCGSNNCAL
jgi:UDP-N-acetylmuramyl pentapeptide synthase